MGFNEVRRAKEWKLENRKFIEGRYERRGMEPSVHINKEELDLNKIPDKSLKLDEKVYGGNGAGFNALIRKMDNKSLVDHIYKCLMNVNIRHDQDITYDESIMNILLPELLDRFEDIDREMNPSRYENNPKVVLRESNEFDNLFED